MNPAVRKIANFIRKHKRFLVSGHVRSDGDALGSQLAFWFALRKMKKQAHVVCDHGVLPDYAFLPGTKQVGSEPADLRPPYDAVITFDSGSWKRLERISEALDRKSLTVINVDHHASNDRFGDLNWIDPRYSSSGEMAWDLIRELGVKPDKNIGTCVYTAIVTDTGKFSFSNTIPETHLRAAEILKLGVKPHHINYWLFRQKTPQQIRFTARLLDHVRLSDDGKVGWVSVTNELVRETGFNPGDTQEYIDTVKSIKGVLVALLFRELDGKVKMSFRTHEGINGIDLASKWGGGGHVRASGASVSGRPLSDVEKEVVAETIRFVSSPTSKK